MNIMTIVTLSIVRHVPLQLGPNYMLYGFESLNFDQQHV